MAGTAPTDVRCLLCEEPMDVVDATNRAFDDLPEQFVARCPHCNSQCLYVKGGHLEAAD